MLWYEVRRQASIPSTAMWARRASWRRSISVAENGDHSFSPQCQRVRWTMSSVCEVSIGASFGVLRIRSAKRRTGHLVGGPQILPVWRGD